MVVGVVDIRQDFLQSLLLLMDGFPDPVDPLVMLVPGGRNNLV